MRQILTANHILSTLSVVLLLLSVSSCREKKRFAEPDIRSVQINSLKLSARSVPELAKTFFSIDHRKSLIYNAIPLKRGTVLDSVAFNVLTHDYNNIEVRVGGVAVPKSPKDSVYMRDYVKGVEIAISNEKHKMSKVYRLQLAIYDKNPYASEWTVEQAAPEHNKHQEGLKSFFRTTPHGHYYLYAPATGTASLYSASLQTPSLWTLRGMLPEGIRQMTVLDAERLILKKEDGSLVLWRISSSTTEPLNIKAEALLGTIHYPNSTETRPALVLKDAQGVSRFAVLNLSASPADRIVWGEVMPEHFPLRDMAEFPGVVEHRQVLNLLGGFDAQGKASQNLWSTTTGLDWLSPQTAEADCLPAFANAPIISYHPKHKIHICIAAGSTVSSTGALRIFVSNDRGVKWQEVAVPGELLPEQMKGKNFGAGMGLYSSSDGMMYLFGGWTNEMGMEKSLFIGKPAFR